MGLLDFIFGSNDPPPAPDYTPVANASKESAEIMAKLGREQLDESRRQYDKNSAVAGQVVDAQLSLMDQTRAQGDDYFNYMKENARPVETALKDQAIAGTAAEDKAAADAITARATALGAETRADGAALDARYGAAAAALRAEAGALGGRAEAGLTRVGTDADRRMTAISGGLRDYVGKNEADIKGDIGLYTSGNRAITDRYGNDIQFDVDNAIADARAGQTSAANTAARTALRYGLSPAALSGATSVANARQLAAAANATRSAATDKDRGLVGSGIGMKQGAYNTGANTMTSAAGLEGRGALTAADLARMGILTSTELQGRALTDSTNLGLAGADKSVALRQAGGAQELAALTNAKQMATADDAKGFAKKMDVAGLYRNLPGASQGAYSLSTGAGNSAVNNSMAPGGQLLNGMAQGANITGQGQQMQLNGLGGILNSQTSIYNTGQQGSGDMMGGLGSLLGSAAAAKTAFFPSSKKIKTDKKPVKAEVITRGLQRIPVEAWSYKEGEGDGGRHIGGYAEDMHREFGDVVAPGGKAVDMISMHGLEVAAIGGLADRMDRIERKLGLERIGSGKRDDRSAPGLRRKS